MRGKFSREFIHRPIQNAEHDKSSLNTEVEAYKAQFSYGGAFPIKSVQKVDEINVDLILKIVNVSGNPVYEL
jgi:hypothetical protein